MTSFFSLYFSDVFIPVKIQHVIYITYLNYYNLRNQEEEIVKRFVAVNSK